MEITFKEVELVKQLLQQTIAGANKIKEIGKDDFQAVIDFIKSDNKEDAEATIELLIMQRDEAQQLLDRINEEFGFEGFEPDGKLEPIGETKIPETARGQISVIGKCRKEFETLCESDGVDLQPMAVLEGYIVFSYNTNPVMRERLLWHLKSIYEEKLLKSK